MPGWPSTAETLATANPPQSSSKVPRKRPWAGAPAPSTTTTAFGQQPAPYSNITGPNNRRNELERVESSTEISATSTDLTETSISYGGSDSSEGPGVTKEVSFASGTKGGNKNGVSTEGAAADAPQSAEAGDPPTKEPTANEQMQAAMQDNLDLMLEVVMRIREDPEFASNIYKECPRLQHMLDQHPALRPLFEDPKLVRINFEQVYVQAGGVLPEDNKPKSLMQRIVQSPFFKVLKVVLFAKKIMTCVMGGGVAFAGAMFAGCFSAEVDGGGHDGDHDGDGDGDDDMDEKNREQKDALERAAERMEDKEQQQRMHDICEEHDPQKLLEEIEDNPDLKALRDSNPLCAELMSDPETMKILVDPDNLRELGGCSELIEQDFANSDWSPPDIADDFDGLDLEVEGEGSGVDAGASEHPGQSQAVPGDSALDTIGEADVETDEFLDAQEEISPETEAAVEEHAVEPEEGAAEEGGAEPDEEAGVEDDGEGGEAEEEDDGMEYDHGDAEDSRRGSQRASKGAQKKPPPKNKNNQAGGGGGFFGSLQAGLQDMVASELVGMSASEFTGGGDELAGLEEAADDLDAMEEAADQADQAADAAMALDSAAEMVDAHGDALDGLEDGMDEVEDGADGDDKGKKAAKVGGVTAGGAAAGGAAGAAMDRKKKKGDVEDGEGGDEEPEKKSRFGVFGNLAGSLSTALKEHVAGNILGDDLGEMLVEKVEEESSSSESDDDDDSDSDSDDDERLEDDQQDDAEKGKGSKDRGAKDKGAPQRRSLFGRK